MEKIQYIFIDDTPKRPRGRPKKKPEDKMPGRPQTYSIELGNQICEWLANGKSLTSFCAIDGNPSYSTIMRWLWKGSDWYREEFSNNYIKAREQQAQYHADQIIDIADDGINDYMELQDKSGKKYIKVNGEYIQRSRLRIEARQWIAKNLLPKVYGDKADLKLDSDRGGPVIMKIVYEDKKMPDGQEET